MKSAILQTSLLSVCALLLSACAEKEVSFKADIQPILAKNCLECHAAGGAGAEKSGLLMSSYEDLMKGTRFGAIVKPGDVLTSALIMLPSDRLPTRNRPMKASRK